MVTLSKFAGVRSSCKSNYRRLLRYLGVRGLVAGGTTSARPCNFHKRSLLALLFLSIVSTPNYDRHTIRALPTSSSHTKLSVSSEAVLAVRHAAGGGAGLDAAPLCRGEVVAKYLPQVAVALRHIVTLKLQHLHHGTYAAQLLDQLLLILEVRQRVQPPRAHEC
jgi:hypothetical protein